MGVKLNANIISKGKYWRSGEDVPTELVPPHIAAAYAAQDTVADEAATRPQPSKPAAATHIKVGSSWKPIAPGQQAPRRRLHPHRQSFRPRACGRAAMKGKKRATAQQEPPEARKSAKERKLRRANRIARPRRPAVREGRPLGDDGAGGRPLDERAWMDWR